MKKILTLLLAAGTLTATQAQTSKEEARRIILGDGNGSRNGGNGRDVILGGGGNNGNEYPGNYPSNNSDRQYRIDQINREYDNKVQFAIDSGTTYKVLRLMNPWLRGKSLAAGPGKSYVLKLPAKAP